MGLTNVSVITVDIGTSILRVVSAMLPYKKHYCVDSSGCVYRKDILKYRNTYIKSHYWWIKAKVQPIVRVEHDGWTWYEYRLLRDDGGESYIPGVALIYGSWYGEYDLCPMAYYYKDGDSTNLSVANLQLRR